MKMKRILGILIHLIVFSSLKITALGSPKTKHLTVVFRHGDRAPDSTTAEEFPNDPYVNDTFFPGGPGGLTNAGKLRAYQLGEIIRRNYNDFLGDIYSPSEVFARSTDYMRTVMTLHLVMAGAFPPSQAQKWHSTLNWQPVIANFEIGAQNFLPLLCPAYYTEVERVKNTPEVRERIDAFKEYIEYISQAAGKEIKTLKDMALLYHALTAESAMGRELRGWALEAFNNGTLLSATLLDYETTNYNARVKTLNGGRVLKYIVNNMTGIIEGTSKVKLNLFSGHETNVVALLSTLGVFKPHMPTYTSAVFVELLEDGSDHFVKVQYYKGNPPVFEELTIPGCTSPCPFETFKTLLKDVTPTDEDMHCRTL